MSLATVDAQSERVVVNLQELLQKREYHLAELIDEVVFAEQERYKAVQDAHCVRELADHLESAFAKLLQYHITMHKEVLLPALMESVPAQGASALAPRREVTRSDNDAEEPADTFLNDLLAEPQLSRETKQLLKAVMRQRKVRGGLDGVARNGTSSAPPAPSSSPPPRESTQSDQQRQQPQRTRRLADDEADNAAVVQRATHRAIMLSDSLLQNQETLTELLRSIQEQAEGLLDHWDAAKKPALHAAPSSPPSSPSAALFSQAKARAAPRVDADVVRTPSPRSGGGGGPTQHQTRAGHSPVAPFRLENLHQHSNRAREIEGALRSVENERDALQRQLLERENALATVSQEHEEAWAKERLHLKQELAYAQQRALEEQARCRELKKQVTQLEKVAATSPIAAPAAAPLPPSRSSSSASTACPQCERVKAELKKKAADYHAAKAAWRAEEKRLRSDIVSLTRQLEDAQQEAERALAPPPPLPPASVSAPAAAAASAVEGPRYPAGPSSERKIGHLEATVAAMKADLQIMEMRMSIVQDEREAERRRILATHEQERERLRRERDECQRIIAKMSRELQGLSQANGGSLAIASTSL